MASRLTHDDRKSVETACLALSRLADSYKHDTAKLEEIARPEVLTNLQQLLVTQPLVPPNTFTTCLHILVVLAGNGSKIGQQVSNVNWKCFFLLLCSVLLSSFSSRTWDAPFTNY